MMLPPVELTASLLQVFNLLFQSLELCLIDARYPFAHGPLRALSQEVLNYSNLSSYLTFRPALC